MRCSRGGRVSAPFVEDGGVDACLDLSVLVDEFVLHADYAECGPAAGGSGLEDLRADMDDITGSGRGEELEALPFRGALGVQVGEPVDLHPSQDGRHVDAAGDQFAEHGVPGRLLAEMEGLGVEGLAKADDLLCCHGGLAIFHFLTDLEVLEVGVGHDTGRFDGHGVPVGVRSDEGEGAR